MAHQVPRLPLGLPEVPRIRERSIGVTLSSKRGIAYEERGAGATFIAIHGYSLDRRMSIGAFEPAFKARAASSGAQGTAAKTYRRVYLDLPFMGESEDSTGGSGHEGFVDALCDFIDEVAPGERILLAGQSFGGYLSRALAARLGERVAGLFLLCPSIIGGQTDRDVDPLEVVAEEPGWKEAAIAAGATLEEIAGYEDYAASRSIRSFERYRDEILVGIRLARLSKLDAYPPREPSTAPSRGRPASSSGGRTPRPAGATRSGWPVSIPARAT
jgi:Predicted hydrolases or acyltransferases (alpha/beta hydrolase superfamily)